MSLAAGATLAPSAYWYLARGTGAVALVLLTASVVIGILGSVRFVAAAVAAVRDRRGPPRHLAAGDRGTRDPHRHERPRRVRADHAARRGDPVQFPLPAAVAGAWNAVVRSARRDRRHQPRPAAAGISRLARGSLARVRELAGRGAARSRDRQRRQAVVDAGVNGDLHHGGAGSGVAADRIRGCGPRRPARAGDGARGDHSHRADDLRARGSAPARVGETRRDAGVVARSFATRRSKLVHVRGQRSGAAPEPARSSISGPFTASLSGSVRESAAPGGAVVDLTTSVSGQVRGRFRVRIAGQPIEAAGPVDDREPGRPRARRGAVGPPGNDQRPARHRVHRPPHRQPGLGRRSARRAPDRQPEQLGLRDACQVRPGNRDR